MPSRKTPKPSQLLKDMRLVYKQEPELDATPGQKQLRKLFADNPASFMTQLGKLENEQKNRIKDAKLRKAERMAAAAGKAVEKMPEKEGAIVSLIDHLVAEWKTEKQ